MWQHYSIPCIRLWNQSEGDTILILSIPRVWTFKTFWSAVKLEFTILKSFSAARTPLGHWQRAVCFKYVVVKHKGGQTRCLQKPGHRNLAFSGQEGNGSFPPENAKLPGTKPLSQVQRLVWLGHYRNGPHSVITTKTWQFTEQTTSNSAQSTKYT